MQIGDALGAAIAARTSTNPGPDMKDNRLPLTVLVCAGLTAYACRAADVDQNAATSPSYAYATKGVLDGWVDRTGIKWKVVIDRSNLGGNEIEIAEATFPAGTTVNRHPHRSVEIIYVLSGVYDHEVNGRLYRLMPGMVGIVRPGDTVRHLVPSDGEARLLILWVPAGEVARILSKAKGDAPEPVPESQK